MVPGQGALAVLRDRRVARSRAARRRGIEEVKAVGAVLNMAEKANDYPISEFPWQSNVPGNEGVGYRTQGEAQKAAVRLAVLRGVPIPNPTRRDYQ